ncbi:MAG: tape measure protein [Candidatus Pristimantibacillus lignocellulolyticus]|uniref:Tape measure protein n=1 Tax=Candidatus Pristimantibacillus lignocellulolyticus TaxID=2994561 RepID=A0A9J6ZF30_9BACL|nr:MAG: tape measure protein [Candidatus Pristimantibacillus lignocellulolyticus]
MINIATVSATLKIVDQLSKPLQKITVQMNSIINTMERMKRIVETPLTMTLNTSKAQKQIANISNSAALAASLTRIAILEKKILDLQTKVNQSVKAGGSAASGWVSKLKNFISGKLSMKDIQVAIKVSDDYVNTLARINQINDKSQTTKELQDKIFASAERSRTSYMDTASVIGRMGSIAPDAFSNNDELIAFTELVQKSFRLGGSGAKDQQAGMSQIIQAMSSGKIQGGDFSSIAREAPMIAAAISNFTGKSTEQLMAMSAEGLLTSDIIKGAMFSAADEINQKFDTLPNTFADIFTQLKNSALQSFGGVIEQISEKLNSGEVDTFMQNMSLAFSGAARAALGLLSMLASLYEFVATNWIVIEPIIWGVGAAMAGLLLITTLTKAGIVAATIATMIQTIFNTAATIVTYGLAAAWRTLSAAMKANVIILIISLIVALIVWLVDLWNTNDNFAAGMMRAWNSVLNFFDQVPIFFVKMGFGILNALLDMKVGALGILEQLVNGVIDGVNLLIGKLKLIPGVSLDVLSHVNLTANAAAEAAAIRQAGQTVISQMESDAADKAAEREQKVVDMLDGRANKRAEEQKAKEKTEMTYEVPGSNSIPESVGGNGSMGDINSVGEVGEVGKINDTVDISSEDLKMMRELAEMKNIQNYVTLTPSVSFGDTHVRNESDINTIVSKITQKLEQDIASSANAVYG